MGVALAAAAGRVPSARPGAFLVVVGEGEVGAGGHGPGGRGRGRWRPEVASPLTW